MPSRARRGALLLLLAGGVLAASGAGAAPARVSVSPGVTRSSLAVSAAQPGGGATLGAVPRQPPMPSVAWAGQMGPQGPDPLIPNAYIITAATHPLATLTVPNPSSQSQTYAIDLFIADHGLPARAYGSNAVISHRDWPGVIWDWAGQPSAPPDTLTVPAGMSASTSLDWPELGPDRRPVATGKYYAVVTAVPTSHRESGTSFEEYKPIVLATSLPHVPREDCLGYPAADTPSGLPSPFPVQLDPGINVPGAQITFAGIRVSSGHCNLSGSDPEVAVIAFTNPGSRPVSWTYDVAITVSNQQDGPGPGYCDARSSSPATNSGSIAIPGHGVASVVLAWPHCPGNTFSPAAGFYVVGVTATTSAMSSSAGQLVYLEP